MNSEIKKLYIIRHGETDFNRLGIVQGSGVDTPLNETGIDQGFRFYRHYKDEDFDKLYISSLQRTRQTVQWFIKKGLSHTSLPELNEISWGRFEGHVQDFKEQEFYRKAVAEWNNGNYHESVPGGETPYELQQRQKTALKKIMDNTHEKKVLICMHGRAMKSFLCLLLDKELKYMDNFEHSNTGLYLLHHIDSKFELIKQNDRSHLER